MQITSAVAEARKEGGEWQGPLANPLKMAAIASHPTLGENLMEDKRRRLHLSLLLFSIKSFSPPSESDFILCPLSVRVCLWGAAATLLMLRAKKAKEGVGQTRTTQAPHLLFSLIFYDRRAAFETNSPNLRQDSLWSLISLFAAPELSFTAAPDWPDDLLSSFEVETV